MKKVLLAVIALALTTAVYYTASADDNTANTGIDYHYVSADMPKLTGIAFVAGEGGHIALINLATMKSPVSIQNDRITITNSGSEMEGKIAGMSFEKIKRGGGIHASAIVGDKLYVGLLDGRMVVHNLKTGMNSEPVQIGQKICDVMKGPDNSLYLEDMADGHIYQWNYKKAKLVDDIPVGAAVCGIQWVHNNKVAYVADMPTGTIYVLDWTTKKVVKKITDPQMTFIHQIHLRPHTNQLWVSAPNEYDPGLKPPTHKSQLVVIDTDSNKVVDHIVLPEHRYPHDVAFTQDGKWVLIPARTYQDDSRLMVMNADSHKVVADVSACGSCHEANGIVVKMAEGHPNLCGITVGWGMKHKPIGG
ncbi:MAG: hypothetical protein M0018_08675 [Nitrospiraceae bacterium]|nr:hypothetical protein [Nitrospiraceae bacterium]